VFRRRDGLQDPELRASFRVCSKWAARSSVSFAKRNPARVCGNTGGISGTLMYGFGGDSSRAPLRKRRNAQAVPYEHPAGMRI
jgi:hypothetical protein